MLAKRLTAGAEAAQAQAASPSQPNPPKYEDEAPRQRKGQEKSMVSGLINSPIP